MTDVEFARVVNEITSETDDPSARFGDRKVFVSAIWDVASADPEIGDMGEREFKRRLVAAHQAQRITLSRADLVSAMPPDLVRKSEIIADGATFHFVNDRNFTPPAGPPVDILAAVKQAVSEMPSSGRYGTNNVFISEIWRAISADPRIRSMGLPAFKRWLVTANRDQRLSMARADLVDDMDQRMVAESQINHLNAQFHFVLDNKKEPWEMMASPPHRAMPYPNADLLPAVQKAVQKAVREMPPSGRFGVAKVFISEVWRVISEDPRIKQIGIVAFKRWLIAANRDRDIDLARADLVGAMNPNQVRESETESMGTTFHFIVDRDAERRGFG